MRFAVLLLVLGLTFGATSASFGGQASPRHLIVFSSPRTGMLQVYALDPVRNRLSQLTFGGDDACPDDVSYCGALEPKPSPDGRLVAYVSSGFPKGLWVVRPDGTGRRRLAVASTRYGSIDAVTWSPDSKRITFTDNYSGDPDPVRVVRVDGRSSREVGRWKDVRWLGWSPDGRRLAVQFRPDSRDALNTSVELVGIDGWIGGSDFFETPQWRPDSTGLALSSDGRIELVAVDGARRPIGRGTEPRWSPDGTLLAYVTSRGLKIVEPDRRNALVLELRGKYTDPTWSPDGRRLALWTPKGVNLVALRPYRRAVVPLPPRSDNAELAWSPDGTYLVYESGSEIRVIDLPSRRSRSLGTTFPGSGGSDSTFAWLTPPTDTKLRAAEPLGPVATSNELRARQRVLALAADGSRVAVQTCLGVTVWEPRVEARPIENPLPLCDPYYYGRTLYGLALGAGDVAWATSSAAGNSSFYQVIARPPTGGSAQVVGDPGGHFRYHVFDELAGYALGHGPLLVFSTMDQCSSSCSGTPGGTTVKRQWVWRLRERGFDGACPGPDGSTVPGRCQLLATANGPLAPLAVDDTRVVVRHGDGAVEVLDAKGNVVSTIPFGRGEALGAELDGGDLVVIRRGKLLHYEATTGRLVHTWPLADVPSSGYCGLEPSTCGSTPLRLDDLAQGLVVYVLNGDVHMLRLTDGADRVVAAGEVAQLEPVGLYVGGNVGGRWPGRVRFTPFAVLPLR